MGVYGGVMDTDRFIIDPALLNDVLPVGVLVTDAFGIIRHANLRASELTGYDRDEAIGRSILDFIAADDVEFLIASLAEGSRYEGKVMGPARLKYRDRHGHERWTEYWAFGCPPAFGFEGYVVTMSTESVADNLAKAVHDIAVGEPVEVALASVARAVSAYPITATGTVLMIDGERLRIVGTWPVADELVDDPTMPWHEVARTGWHADIHVRDLPRGVGIPALAAGFASMWIRPITGDDGATAAVFIAWRDEPGAASLNQERQLDEVVRVARLAFVHEAHRLQLQRAALVDPLTGLGNRAFLTQRLATAGDEPSAVLYVDLDGFKAVNDTYGHDVGDLVLTVAGQRISALVRDGDDVFRVGGDEFIVVCAGIPNGPEDADAAGAIAQRIVDALGAPFEIGRHGTLQIGASVGVADRRPDDSGEHLVRRSDRALLQAKRDGKSRWHRADD